MSNFVMHDFWKMTIEEETNSQTKPRMKEKLKEEKYKKKEQMNEWK